MLKLSIMTEQELNQIFGTLDSLIPLHEGEGSGRAFPRSATYAQMHACAWAEPRMRTNLEHVDEYCGSKYTENETAEDSGISRFI